LDRYRRLQVKKYKLGGTSREMRATRTRLMDLEEGTTKVWDSGGKLYSRIKRKLRNEEVRERVKAWQGMHLGRGRGFETQGSISMGRVTRKGLRARGKRRVRRVPLRGKGHPINKAYVPHTFQNSVMFVSRYAGHRWMKKCVLFDSLVNLCKFIDSARNQGPNCRIAIKPRRGMRGVKGEKIRRRS